MIDRIESQLALLGERLRQDNEKLLAGCADLERVRAEGSLAVSQAAALRERLFALEDRVSQLSEAEAALTVGLRSRAESVAELQSLEARLRRSLRSQQGFQQSLLVLPRHRGEAPPALTKVDVGAVRDGATGKLLTFDFIASSSGSGAEASDAVWEEAAAQLAGSAVDGYSETVIAAGPTASAACLDLLLPLVASGLFDRFAGTEPCITGSGGVAVGRYRVSCSVASVDAAGRLAGLRPLDGQCAPCAGLAPPCSSDGSGHCAAHCVASVEDVMRLLRQRKRHGAAAPPSLVLLLVESFDAAGNYRRAAVRFVTMAAQSPTADAAALRLLRDAIALAGAAPALAGAASAVEAKVYTAGLQELPSRDAAGPAWAALLDPVFFGSSKALLVVAAEEAHDDHNDEGIPPYASIFRRQVRHCAEPYVLPAELLAAARAVVAATILCSDSDEESNHRE